MKNIKVIIKCIPVILLVIIAVLTHVNWFIPTTTLTFSDWSFFTMPAIKELWHTWGAWLGFANLGGPNIQIPFLFFDSIWSLIGNLGFSYDIATKITFFIPVAILGFISPYVLSLKLTKNKLISFVCSLFYGTTTYFLILQTSHMPIAFIYGLAPLIFYIYIKALEKNTLISWICFVLIYCLGIFYEVRIMYLVSLMLGIYFLFFYIKQIRNYIKYILMCMILVILLNVFWLLPVIFGGIVFQIGAVADRGLFGGDLANILYAITIFHWSWTGGYTNRLFEPQPILWHFWIIPGIIIFLLIKQLKNVSYIKQKIFFLTLLLIGIFLTKQSAAPFPNAYFWLYSHFPGFNLFRESSKMYLLVAFGYMGLLGYLLLDLKEFTKSKKKYLYHLICFIIIVVSLWNLKPLFNKDIDTLFISRNIPSEYLILNNFIARQEEYFRTGWLPSYSRWGIFTALHPKLEIGGVLDGEWSAIYNRPPYDKVTSAEAMIDALKKSYIENLINIASIKYIIIPLTDTENNDDIYRFFGKNKEFYVQQLDKLAYLKKINIGTEETVVYLNTDYRPHVYTTSQKETIYNSIPYKKVIFNSINPAQYKIILKNISKPLYLNFSELYDPYWKIRIGNFSWFDVLFNKNYFLSSRFHFQNNAVLNSFYIDPKVICNNFQCTKNTDGSYDINLTLYYTSQSYMYLGLAMGGVTLLAVAIYLSVAFIKPIKQCLLRKCAR